ncbi:MAG TPA: GMC oxidoreductase, partial [Acidimicrobiales bacterium]|nr:GMC oxidoreductase [Acidimicrobiales bacterium]
QNGAGEPLIDTPLVRTGVFQIRDLRMGEAYRDELEAMDDVDVVLRATAVDLRLAGDAVEEVRARTLGGVELSVTGMRVVVMALGGIENARVLLACNSQRPDGLGNERDLVGRHFCEHFAVPAAIAVSGNDPGALSALFEADVDAELGSLRVKGNVSLTSQAVRDNGLLSLDCQVVVGRYAEERPRTISGVGISEVAAVAQATGTQAPRSSLYLLATAEQELNPDSRVRLGRQTDALGMPQVELDWQFTELDRRSIIEGMTLIGDELARTGVGRLQVTPGTIRFERTDGIRPYVGGLAIDADAADPEGFELGLGFHHMCTTRMASSPAEGVVDADLRVHTVDNLFVAGSSSFGTAGASTPTYSLVALSLRLADHLLTEVLA